MLAEEVSGKLEAENPAAFAWLQSITGLLLQLGLLAFYVFVDTFKGLSTAWAMSSGKVQGASLIIMNSFCSILIGAGLTWHVEGKDRLIASLKDFASIKGYALVATLFNISSVVNTMAYSTALDAGTIKILGQLRLPLAAGMSGIFLGKTYSPNHWIVLVMLTLTVIVFFDGAEERKALDKAPVKSHASGTACTISGAGEVGDKGGQMVGLLYVTVWALIVVSASLITERFMKSSAKTPFYIQKMQMELTGVFAAVFMAFFGPAVIAGGAWDSAKADKMWWTVTPLQCEENYTKTVGGGGLFENWSMKPVCQLCIAILHAWLGGIIVKKFTTVVKNIAKSVSLIFTVIFNEILFPIDGEPLRFTMYLLAGLIFCATILFAQLEKPERPKQPPPAATGRQTIEMQKRSG